jgi:tryptophanyl-tRNA synthetase
MDDTTPKRVVSGMRPTGALHLGHYHGVLKNWTALQHQHDCYFFVADWHALTTHFEDPGVVAASVWDMVVDWLAAGVDPNAAKLFIQSRVPEHAELHLLLSMVTPLGWLERVPTYKDQQEKLAEKDLSMYGFLGYPVLQSADVLIYKANLVPVGEDQLSHLEIAREIARRFNHIYGAEPDFEKKVQVAIKALGSKNGRLYKELRKQWQEQGVAESLDKARALVLQQPSLTRGDRDRLLGWIEGTGRSILVEPQALLTKAAKFPGLDGQKMSKSYNNTIALRDAPADVEKKIKQMPTDPARVRRTDPGDPEKCPVWQLHQVYSDAATQDWVQKGCRSAGIGCLECKKPVIDAVNAELAPMRERAAEWDAAPERVREVIQAGCEAAREAARDTMDEVRQAMGLGYL